MAHNMYYLFHPLKFSSRSKFNSRFTVINNGGERIHFANAVGNLKGKFVNTE